MEVPGGIYLCQVSDTVSCGACCGLYNAADASFETLHARLSARADAFARVPRDPASIEAFARDIAAREPGERPLPGFHHCPFLGLIGRERSRAGCLLHPLAEGNDGVDLRGLSHYGGMACKICFCPAHRVLAPRFRDLLRRTAPDWHAYGILVTEALTLEALLLAAEAAVGGTLDADSLETNPAGVAAIRALYDLVLGWPFRRPGFPLGTYFLGDEGHLKAPVDYTDAGGRRSRHEPVLRELASVFRSPGELARAERLLDEVLDRLADVLSRGG
jgi:hypothetical protein